MLSMARAGSIGDRGTLEKRAFARVLITVREDRGLTQETLAFDSGYHPKYISMLERGINSPSLTAILEIARALAPIIARLPNGYRIETGGNIEDSAKANSAL